MNNSMANELKQSYRSVRAPAGLAQRIQHDFEGADGRFNLVIPAFASLVIGALLLVIFRAELSSEIAPADPSGIPRLAVSQVTAQTGRFARLSMGQLKMPRSAPLNVPVSTAGLPLGMPQSPAQPEAALKDG